MGDQAEISSGDFTMKRLTSFMPSMSAPTTDSHTDNVQGNRVTLFVPRFARRLVKEDELN